MTRATTRRTPAQRAAGQGLKFDERLVLNQWMLCLFGVKDFNALAERLRDPQLEGFDEDHVSRFYRTLSSYLPVSSSLTADVLLGYDQHIVRHWLAITERRNRSGHILYPTYFQYLALLFTEIYLDRYFQDEEQLRADLNGYVAEFNARVSDADRIDAYESGQLNKLACWNATGSGKTLLMHINIQQFRYYLHLHGREGELNRIILLTPNEGLSKQHRDEFEHSGIEAELFVKEGRGLFAGQSVEIIDIYKLRENSGNKTVAIDAFEGNNLVLVDEGHRGSSGEDWKAKRDRLCEQGFSFEYSATFGQAMKAANKRHLTQEYARCIVFDYSYKYFYQDGYGKDYRILNLEDDRQQEIRDLYMTACLLVFYQQLRLYQERKETFQPYLIDRPLWVFVGGTVTKTLSTKDASDIIEIVLFLARFVRDRTQTVSHIARLLRGNAGLRDGKGREIFANAFTYLSSHAQPAEGIFNDILWRVFNAPAQAALHVELLKGADDEIALKLGNNQPFGAINVGDASKLAKLCEEQQSLVVTDREFADSLFRALDKPDTTINLLIGSKKFTEGWNSWRVSTMGLMNVGKGEGSEIIQLFGRGVRLKGYGFGLKRSRHVPDVVQHPKYVEDLETLNIFGIKASYMQQFKEYLSDEGLPDNEERVECVLPVMKNRGTVRLQSLRVRPGIDFKQAGQKPTLGPPPGHLLSCPITVDWYPKVQAEQSQGLQVATDVVARHEGRLSRQHIAFLDFDAIFFELQRFKNERAWYNLSLSRQAIQQLLENPTWYRLLIPAGELAFTSFDRVRLWQEIAVTLLKKYIDRYYKYRKNEYELPHLESRTLAED